MAGGGCVVEYRRQIMMTKAKVLGERREGTPYKIKRMPLLLTFIRKGTLHFD